MPVFLLLLFITYSKLITILKKQMYTSHPKFKPDIYIGPNHYVRQVSSNQNIPSNFLKPNQISNKINEQQIIQNISSTKQQQIKDLIIKLDAFIKKIDSIKDQILQNEKVQDKILSINLTSLQIRTNFKSFFVKFNSLKTTLQNYTTLKTDTKLQQNNHKQHLNISMINMMLNYFNEHMIAQTHWSIKKQEQKTSLFSNFRFSCLSFNRQQAISEQILSVDQIIERQQKQRLKQTSILEKQKASSESTIQSPLDFTLRSIIRIQQLKALGEMSCTQKLSYLLDLQNKIFVCSQFLQSAISFPDDITTLSHSYYQPVWDYINENNIGDEKVINGQFRLMKRLMVVTNASVIKELGVGTEPQSVYKKMVFGIGFGMYFLTIDDAKLQNNKFLRKPTILVTKSIWNLPENGMIKQLKKPLVFEMIKVNLEFYVPRVPFRKLSQIKTRVYNQNIDIFQHDKNSIRVRLLNASQINLGKSKKQNVFETIIIHFHGGGFIALSSCTSQTYTRKWANSLKIPVFSVDYGKPPDYRFPIPILDCLQVYNFITTKISKYMNINPKRVFVVGDSAGGGLACSLTALTMKLDLLKPQGLFLAYPAVDTRAKFTPSRINSFNDIILYPTLLMLCMKQYLGQESEINQYDPLASPILLTQDYISGSFEDKRWPLKWPKTIVVVGRKDPLFDDSLRLCQRLRSSNIQFHCQIYKNLSHAFLSIDKMVTSCAQSIQDSIAFLQKLISGQTIGKQILL